MRDERYGEDTSNQLREKLHKPFIIFRCLDAREVKKGAKGSVIEFVDLTDGGIRHDDVWEDLRDEEEVRKQVRRGG